jgi:hypothetical protein
MTVDPTVEDTEMIEDAETAKRKLLSSLLSKSLSPAR